MEVHIVFIDYQVLKVFQHLDDARNYTQDRIEKQETKGRVWVESHVVTREGTVNPTPENVKCPECNGPMASRTGKFGTFWGCKNYPMCKGTRDSMGMSKAERAKEKGEAYEADTKDETNRFSFKRTE